VSSIVETFEEAAVGVTGGHMAGEADYSGAVLEAAGDATEERLLSRSASGFFRSGIWVTTMILRCYFWITWGSDGTR